MPDIETRICDAVYNFPGGMVGPNIIYLGKKEIRELDEAMKAKARLGVWDGPNFFKFRYYHTEDSGKMEIIEVNRDSWIGLGRRIDA